MPQLKISNPGGITDEELWLNLTWSATLIESSKDILWWHKVIIDFWMHQWSKNAYKFNKEIPKELLDADVLIITHVHIDHIWRVPQLVKAWFKWRIIMSPFTKTLAKHMWTDDITLTKREIEKIEHWNKKKSFMLKNYIDVLNIDKKLKEEKLNKEERTSLELKKEKILNWKKLEDFENESKNFLNSIGSDIEIIKLFTKNEANSLIEINERINDIYRQRSQRIEKDLKYVKDSLKDAKKYLENKDYDYLEKEKFKISYYPNEAKKLKEEFWISSIEYKILDSIKYEKNYKSDFYKKESKELKILEEKLVKITKWKDLELCLSYANKILWNNNFENLKSNIPELLYDIEDVYKTLEKIETLEVWEEVNLDDRIVVTRNDSEVIEKLPKIIEAWYKKKIYVLPLVKQYIISYFMWEYNDTIKQNETNKRIREEYLFLKKYLKNNGKLKLDNNVLWKKFVDDEFYKEKISDLEEEISKLSIVEISWKEYNIKYLLKFFNDNKYILENKEILEKYKNYKQKDLKELNENTKKIVKKDILSYVDFNNNSWLVLNDIEKLIYQDFLKILKWDNIIINRKYRKEFNKKIWDFIIKYNSQIEKNIEKNQEINAFNFIQFYEENMHIFNFITLVELKEKDEKIKGLNKQLEDLKTEEKQFLAYKEKKKLQDFIFNNREVDDLKKEFNRINILLEEKYNNVVKIKLDDDIFDIHLLFNKNIRWIYSYFKNNNLKDIDLNSILKNVKFDSENWIKNKRFLKDDFIKILNWKKVVVNSNYKEEFIKQCNSFLLNNKNDYLIYNYIISLINYFNFDNINQLIQFIDKKKKEFSIFEQEKKELIKKRNVIEYYINLNKLENNPIYIARKDLKKILEYKTKINSEQRIYWDIENITIEDNKKEIEKIYGEINLLENNKFWNFSILELLDFYNKSINGYLNKKSWKSKKEKFDSFYSDFDFFIKNKEKIELLFSENRKVLDEILKIEEEIKKLKDKRINLKNREEKINKRDKFLIEKEKIINEIFEIEQKYEVEINNIDDIEDYLKYQFWTQKLKYTKKQIDKIISKLEVISEKDNKKIVESLKLQFFKAGHIEWSVMVSLSYVIKEIKSKVNGILWYQANNFWWYKEIKKSFKNLLFTWDIWKITEPNLSWSPDIPPYKYDYVQLESTYANREHPNKQKEFEKLIKILNRPWRKLGAAFSLQRTQEPPVEILNLLEDNIINHEKLKKLYIKRRKINSEYKKLIQYWKEEEKRKKFIELTNINQQIENINKNYYAWTIFLDSPSAGRITEEFIKEFPEKYKILDPMVQQNIFWNEKFKILWPWESKRFYTSWKKYKDFFLLSSWWMLQWWAIISHLKELVSDPKATVILFWYVAEWTLWRKLLNWDKKIIINWEEYEVKCKIESIWWYSSHMGQSDLVKFGWELLNYSKNSILSLTHWDNNRTVLKELIEWVNSKINILVPKLGNKLEIKL